MYHFFLDLALKFATLVTFLSNVSQPRAAPPSHNVTVSYDLAYDNRAGTLFSVSCSDGTNGLLSAGFSKFETLPSFPHIGAAAAIRGWNDENCGTCWELTYTDGMGVSKSINMLAIDSTRTGFAISVGSMQELTGTRTAPRHKHVNVAARQVAASVCGL